MVHSLLGANVALGPFACLGKSLAVEELRIAAATLFLAYDVEFAPDFEPERFIGEMLNYKTTVFPYPLRVVTKKRVT
jgi:hypothetical protein